MTPKNSSNDRIENAHLIMIKGGPSKLDLMFALFNDRSPDSEPNGRPLKFKTIRQLPAKTKEYTTYREYEHGIATFYLFKIERNRDNPEWWTLWGILVKKDGEINIKIIYRTDNREGAIYKE